MNPQSDLPGLLLIDDDPLIVESLSFALQPQFTVATAGTRPAAIALLRKVRPMPALALVDLGLPPTPHAPDEGFALIGELLAGNPRMKILILSGQSARANILHALTLGAVDFVPKPCDAELLKARLAHQLLIAEAEAPPGATGTDAILLGASPAMGTLRELIRQFSRIPFPVLIEGESGTGKELVAGCLHRESDRAAEPLVTINCAAFTPDLLEAQLFGYRKGAFTGASDDHPGLLAAADRGTLFLDEVGEMPPELQIKFLRVIENGEYYRLGETRPSRTGARILAATNRDLRAAVRSGAMRADLYHRLSVLSITVPPLRERGGDWRLLLAHFQQQYADKVPPFRLDADALDVLGAYAFPGNVRELRNLVIRVGARYPGRTVAAAQIAAELDLANATGGGQMAAGPSPDGIVAELQRAGFRLDDAVGDLERQYIDTALKLSDGNLSRAARLLGINRTTLYNKVQRHGLDG
jgi:DNA-binding NtrC family response regulator